MAKGVYFGVNNTPRKVTNIYFGIDNAPKKVTRAYIGIGGTPRPFWSSWDGPPVRYGLLSTQLDVSRTHLAGTSVGNYAIFAGGKTSLTSETGVDSTGATDAYDNSLIKIASISDLQSARSHLAASTVNNYALFVGGEYTQAADAFNSSLTRVSNVTNLYTAQHDLSGVTVGNYAFFGGGHYSDSTVTAYYNGPVTTIRLSLSTPRISVTTAATENHALFAGGTSTSSGTASRTTAVDSFNRSLTNQVQPPLRSSPNNPGSAATLNGQAIFFCDNNISIYDSSLTQSFYELDMTLWSEANAVTLGNYCLYSSSYPGQSVSTTQTLCIDKSLTITRIEGLQYPRKYYSAVAVGPHAIMAGGSDVNKNGLEVAVSNAVEAFTLQ